MQYSSGTVSFLTGKQLFSCAVNSPKSEPVSRSGDEKRVSAEGFLCQLDFYFTIPHSHCSQCASPLPLFPVWLRCSPTAGYQHHGKGQCPPCFIPGQVQPRPSGLSCMASHALWESTAHIKETR